MESDQQEQDQQEMLSQNNYEQNTSQDQQNQESDYNQYTMQQKFVLSEESQQAQNYLNQNSNDFLYENEQEENENLIDKPLQMQFEKKTNINKPKMISELQIQSIQKTDFDVENPHDFILIQKYELQQLQSELEELKKQKLDLEQLNPSSFTSFDQLRQTLILQQQQALNQDQQEYMNIQDYDQEYGTMENKIQKKSQQQYKLNLQAQLRQQHSSTAFLDQEKLNFIIDKLGQDMFQDIRELFEYYNSINHPLKCDKMELSSFRKFCQERLGIDKQKQGKMDLEFFKVNLIRFIELLMKIGKKKFLWEQDGYLSLQLLLNEIIKQKDQNLEVMQNYDLKDKEILKIIQLNKPKLVQVSIYFQIFEYYEDKDANTKGTMSQQEFLKFSFQFKIVPNLCSQAEVAKVFRHCIRDLPQESNATFNEFQNSIFYLALISFGRIHYATKYITAIDKLQAFFHWLEISSQMVFLEGSTIKEKIEPVEFQ